MKNLYIVKIGGNILDDDKALGKFLYDFTQLKGLKILIHGGGKLATELSKNLNIPTTLIEGRRITDKETLKVTTMVYAGWVNKNLVAALQALNCNAIGLSGADGKCIITKKRQSTPIDYGFVGDMLPESVSADFLQNILEFGITPVLSPITCDASGQLLNTNADTIASAVAVRLSELYNTHLIYCFEKKGVLLDKNNDLSVIEKINKETFAELKSEKIIAEGMIPKLENAFQAKQDGVSTVVIGHASELLSILNSQDHVGTYIYN